jgi:solute carrier family 13 (sodium-dependent dicarboxylate transporter), member 2/3/5
VTTVRTAFSSFADPVIFVFLGGFILAEAMFVHGVDRRIAYSVLSIRSVGASAWRILAVYGGITLLLSMWMSNTATTAMMFPIGLSLVTHLARRGAAGARQFALATMLMTSFAASIGGLATPVGTPPNLIGIGMLDRIAHVRVTFVQWMALGVPAAALMFAFVVMHLGVAGARGAHLHKDSAHIVQEELSKLGALTRGQRNVLIAFGTTVALWLLPGIVALFGMENRPIAAALRQALPESIAAMIGALMLFVLPTDWRTRRFTLKWEEALQIDWGVILLYGGGLAMGELAFSTGLAGAVGSGIASWLPSHTVTSLTLLFTATATVLSEATSNTATANMIVPVAIAVAQSSGVSPLEPALGATLGASLGFMMPVSTPPNAIVYSSGYVPITAMMRYGIMLDVVGSIVIAAVVLFLSPLVL